MGKLLTIMMGMALMVADSHSTAPLMEESPLILESMTGPAYHSINNTAVFTSGISSPVMVGEPIVVVRYETIKTETTYDITERYTTVTQTWKETLRVGAIR